MVKYKGIHKYVDNGLNGQRLANKFQIKSFHIRDGKLFAFITILYQINDSMQDHGICVAQALIIPQSCV